MSDQDLLQRIEKIERFLSNLGPLVHHAERLAQCERLLVHHDLDIEKNTANVDALLEEYKLQGTINASLKEQINSISERVTALEDEFADREDKEALEHLVSLYGGEQ